MRRSEIEVGKTYANAKGTIHRRVDKSVNSHEVYKMYLNDNKAVVFTVTKGQHGGYSGRSGKCTLEAFCKWAKSEVAADG